MLGTPALETPRYEDLKFKSNMDFTVRPFQTNKKKNLRNHLCAMCISHMHINTSFWEKRDYSENCWTGGELWLLCTLFCNFLSESHKFSDSKKKMTEGRWIQVVGLTISLEWESWLHPWEWKNWFLLSLLWPNQHQAYRNTSKTAQTPPPRESVNGHFALLICNTGSSMDLVIVLQELPEGLIRKGTVPLQHSLGKPVTASHYVWGDRRGNWGQVKLCGQSSLQQD